MVLRNMLERRSNLCRIKIIGASDLINPFKYTQEFLLYDLKGIFFPNSGVSGLLNFDKAPKWYSETCLSGDQIPVESKLFWASDLIYHDHVI